MAKKVNNSSATPALTLLTEQQIPYRLDIHDVDPKSAKGFALDASEVMGVPPEQVFKTLMAEIDGEHVVAVVPADCTLNLKQLAKAGGGKHAAMMDRGRAQVVTGYIAGGISPIGQKNPHRVFLDESAILQDEIYVSAGRRGWSLILAPDDVLRATGGGYADIAER
ncbi:Cys-tRNA(Pro) deacylase [Corynebacterium lubricantis]|uniref:Cys-tRNA(Pro) deacylase n=1 Tax=Corynebacterium lubricantis TaxID=541095 RepID=UPI000375C07D|nr:Cys-tRNA(Pro) deacylase [Corynebacterium lubricantis]